MIGASFILIQAFFLNRWTAQHPEMSRRYTHPILFVWIGIRHFPHLPLAVSKMPRQAKKRFEAQSLCLFRHVVVVDLQEFLGMGDLTKPASEPSCSLGPFDVNTAST